jgi:hypothetical protein
MYVLVLLSAPTMVKLQSIHRAIPIIINQSTDSKENNEKKGSISDTNNNYNDKLREVKKLREKRIEVVRDRLEGLGNTMEPPFRTQLRLKNWILYTRVLHLTETVPLVYRFIGPI